MDHSDVLARHANGSRQRPVSADSHDTSPTRSSYDSPSKRKVKYHRSSTNEETSLDDDPLLSTAHGGRTHRQRHRLRVHEEAPLSASLLTQLRNYAYGRYAETAADHVNKVDPSSAKLSTEQHTSRPRPVPGPPVSFWVPFSDEPQAQGDSSDGQQPLQVY